MKDKLWNLAAIILAASLLTSCVTETIGGSQMKPATPERQIKTLVDLGIGYIRNGEYGRAKDNLNRALSLDENSPLVHNAFGLVFQLEGELGLAETHFKKAIQVDPNFTLARNNYGAFLFQQKRYADAVKQLLVASEDRFYTNRPQVFENLGVSYSQLNMPVEAEQAFLRATQLNPGQSRALLELAEIRFKEQKYVEARDFYRRHAAAGGPSSRSLLFCVRISRVFKANNDEASCALSLKNIFPNSPEYRELEAMDRK